MNICGAEQNWRDRTTGVLDWLVQVSIWINLVFLPVAALSSVREWCFGFAWLFWVVGTLVSWRRRFRPLPLWPFFLAFTVFIVVSIVYAVDPAYSKGEFRGEWLKGVAWFYLVAMTVDTQWKVKAVLNAFLLSGVLMIGYGLLHSVVNPYWKEGLISEASLSAGVGTLSTYLVQVSPFLWLPFLLWPKKKWLGAGATILILGAAFLTVMSTQRAVWLAMAITIPMAVMLLFRSWRWSAVALVVVAGLFISGLLLMPTARWVRSDEIKADAKKPVLKSMLSASGSAFGRRGEIWLAAWNLARERPLTGVGYGRQSLRKASDAFKRYPSYWHAHNTFLNTAAGTGLLGLASFLALLSALFWRACRLWWTGFGLSSWLAGAVATMMAGFLFRNLFNDFFVDDAGLLFWILSALLFVPVWSSSARRDAGQ